MHFRSCVITLVVGFANCAAWAQAPTVTNAFSILNTNSANDGNFATGVIIYDGATVTTPSQIYGLFRDGTSAPFGTALAPFTRPDAFNPNLITATIPWNSTQASALTGPWTYTFSTSSSFTFNTNNATTTTVASPSIGSGTGALPFVQQMTITPNSTGSAGLTPTISWVLPSLTGIDPVTGNPYSINQVRVSVEDNTNTITRTNVDPFVTRAPFQQANVIYSSTPISTNTTSFNLPPTNDNSGNANFGSQVLQYGHTYGIDIQLNNVVNGNTVSRSNSYFDYTPINPTSLGLPANTVINLPTTEPIPTTSGLVAPQLYHFNIGSVTSTSVTYIDPLVAAGFIYTVGAGDPFFRSVNPVTVVGNGIYQLLVLDPTSHQFDFVSSIDAGQTFDFTMNGFLNGVSEFEILGLDPGVDPTDVTAFVTGLKFMADGSFTGTMQPVVLDTSAVPGPTVGAGLPGILFGAGGFIAWWRRKRRRATHAEAVGCT